ncbi:fumarylacetoacetate hydrolase family protein, partial [archaeon]
YIVPASMLPDVSNLSIRTWVNDTLVQDGRTSGMMFSVAALISFLSQGTTLLPGTVICTGTPAGVGYVRNQYLKPGDTVRVAIEGIGTLRNEVTSETSFDTTE